MEQKHLQVRQCLILSFLDVIFWYEHTMIKDQTYQMLYNINYNFSFKKELKCEWSQKNSF